MKIRAFILVSFCLLIVLSNELRSADDRDAQLVLTNAIDALGGKKTLLNIKMHCKAEVAVYGRDAAIGSFADVYFAYPDKFRIVLYNKSKSTPLRVMVSNGKKGWMKTGEEVEEIKEHKVYSLTPLVLLRMILNNDAKLIAAASRSIKTGEQTATEVTFSHPDYNTVYCYFDNKTYRLIEYKSLVNNDKNENNKNDEEVGLETTSFYDYEMSDGVTLPRRTETYVKGERKSSLKITELTILETLDDKLFQEPTK